MLHGGLSFNSGWLDLTC